MEHVSISFSSSIQSNAVRKYNYYTHMAPKTQSLHAFLSRSFVDQNSSEILYN